MLRCILGSLSVVVLLTIFFAPRADAMPQALHPASISNVTHVAPMATIDWERLIRWIIYKYKYEWKNSYTPIPKGSVALPSTLLLFGAGFGGFILWREHRLRRSSAHP